ncbi:hypothetical protein, partial [Campylobacter sp. RM16190]|uniref:hypothetical protein n=1 Tax=Campylobacter sp. RM16190 TaxID=1705727 RepID=UPI001B8CF9AA
GIPTPEITFPEDANSNGTLSSGENSTDPDNTTAKITIPADAKPGDTLKVTVTGPDGNPVSQDIPLTPDNIANGVEITVPVQDGKTSSVEAFIQDQNGNTGGTANGSIAV